MKIRWAKYGGWRHLHGEDIEEKEENPQAGEHAVLGAGFAFVRAVLAGQVGRGWRHGHACIANDDSPRHCGTVFELEDSNFEFEPGSFRPC